MEQQKTQNYQSNPEEKHPKNNAVGITLPDFRQHYKATVIKAVLYWYKNRHTDQRNRLESPEVNLHTYSQLIFDKGGKNIKWEKVSSSSGVGKAGQPHVNQRN